MIGTFVSYRDYEEWLNRFHGGRVDMRFEIFSQSMILTCNSGPDNGRYIFQATGTLEEMKHQFLAWFLVRSRIDTDQTVIRLVESLNRQAEEIRGLKAHLEAVEREKTNGN